MPELQPHEQRVIEEKAQLDEKVAKLLAFINTSPQFNSLEHVDQILLREQHFLMGHYSRILGERIQRFKGIPHARPDRPAGTDET